MRASRSCGLVSCSTSIQPFPYGSWLTSSGCFSRAALTSRTVPPTGQYRSETALTDSTTPKTSMGFRERPTLGSSTNTTSPSCAWAKWVMPTRPRAPSTRIHSCSLVYRQSSGYMGPPSAGPLVEGRGDHAGGDRLAPDHHVEGAAQGRVRHRDVGQADGLVQPRGQGPAGHHAEGGPGLVEGVAGAGDAPARELEAHQLAGEAP